MWLTVAALLWLWCSTYVWMHNSEWLTTFPLSRIYYIKTLSKTPENEIISQDGSQSICLSSSLMKKKRSYFSQQPHKNTHNTAGITLAPVNQIWLHCYCQGMCVGFLHWFWILIGYLMKHLFSNAIWLTEKD